MALPEAPNSRSEQYLAKIAGQETTLPEAPKSRVEQYLEYIAENGTVSEEEIAEQVSAWLEENIHEDPTVVIDASLSVSGAAADAKAAGDEITEIKSAFVEQVGGAVFYTEPPLNYWNYADTVIGQLRSANGSVNTEATLYISSGFIPVEQNDSIYVYFWANSATNGDTSLTLVTPSTGNNNIFAVYDENKTLIRYYYMTQTYPLTIIDANAKFIRVGLSRAHFENNTRKYGVFKREITKDEYRTYKRETEVNNYNHVVSCWGDSLTQGTGATSGNSYPVYLQRLLMRDYDVLSLGIGGQGCARVSNRLGSNPMYVNPCTIPADSTPVTVSVRDLYSNNISLFVDGGNLTSDFLAPKWAINPVIIAGIEGTLTRPSLGSTDCQFTRTTAGEAVTLSSPTFIETSGWRNNRNDITILWIGTNDGSRDSEYVSRFVKFSVDVLNSNRFLILGLTDKSMSTNTDEKNTALKNTYGIRFVDVLAYMLEYGLSEAGITPTSADSTAIADGRMPPSLLAQDGVHMTSAGYRIVANLVYRRGKDLGYWG